MPNKFMIFRNKDSGEAYSNALVDAGFEAVGNLSAADFVLMDHESRGRRRNQRAEFVAFKPGFIYPHTPTTYWLWDGVYESLPVKCNFVAAHGAKDAMHRYGYPYRVEVCGFPRCDVREFQPQQESERKLLFVPARPRKDGGSQAEKDIQALQWIVKNRDAFDRITVCHAAGQFEPFAQVEGKFYGMDFVQTYPSKSINPARDMIKRIESHNLVISVTTPAVLAVARGIPCIMYGQGDVPETITGARPKTYRMYKSLHAFPLDLDWVERDELGSIMAERNELVEMWKENNIGDNFDAEKFVSVVKEYV